MDLSHSIEICERPTNILIQQYADRVFVLVNQTDKIGALIQASLPESTPLPSNTISPAIDLTQLFGSALSQHMHILYHIYASHIASAIWVHEEQKGVPGRRPVVVGLTLVSHQEEGEEEKATFSKIMETLGSMLK